MKLTEALTDGIFLGLETTEEAIMNVAIHAASYFTYDTMKDEFNEIIKDLEALPNANVFMERTEDGRVKFLPDVMIKDYFPEAVTAAMQMEGF